MFCQNYEISHERRGQTYSVSQVARHMLALQTEGCHNINLVTPTHFLPWTLEALHAAAREGLRVPVVYNCGGYERTATLEILKGVVDIYLPDMKYGDNSRAGTYSQAPDYVETNRQAIREMFRQVGPLSVDKTGVARRGLIIRHLVLPNGEAGSESVRRFLAESFDPRDIAVSVMAQYRPLYRAHEYAAISRVLAAEEYERVRDAFIQAGFEGFYQQVRRLDTSFLIDFRRREFGFPSRDTA
jgi:putative pyruvate formate lyase activating enzyme